ncbi:MAG: hypothetical protein II453_01455 [Alphaproteobacteria bacterium]|nr:hypothetical protein [Alphaproteobacteria bacterium]
MDYKKGFETLRQAMKRLKIDTKSTDVVVVLFRPDFKKNFLKYVREAYFKHTIPRRRLGEFDIVYRSNDNDYNYVNDTKPSRKQLQRYMNMRVIYYDAYIESENDVGFYIVDDRFLRDDRKNLPRR